MSCKPQLVNISYCGMMVTAHGIIMVLMFIGRIGPLTLMVSLNNYKAKKADALQYAKADIIIG